MPQTNLETLRLMFAAFNAGDRAAQEALMDPDVTITEAAGLPYGGIYRGIAGWWELIGKIMATYRTVTTVPLEIIGEAAGDRFAALHRLTGTAAATGRTVDLEIFELWVFRAGKIIEVRPFYWDTHAVACATAGTTPSG